ncbi:prevent-host-death protein [Tetragenococcus halophilus]|uniref:prevent-host-death protein n=1 Tax=Tetragenococcus halophilus TaxID=51669 RepID=UPI001F28D36A|nr:prevent-host-death protein [Tetragenococcus halophilus]MCF1684771.1 prevent-host-death protein [Tetragenococcus halophilus]
MKTMTRTELKKDLFKTIDKVSKENTPLEVTMNNNKTEMKALSCFLKENIKECKKNFVCGKVGL